MWGSPGAKNQTAQGTAWPGRTRENHRRCAAMAHGYLSGRHSGDSRCRERFSLNSPQTPEDRSSRRTSASSVPPRETHQPGGRTLVTGDELRSRLTPRTLSKTVPLPSVPLRTQPSPPTRSLPERPAPPPPMRMAQEPKSKPPREGTSFPGHLPCVHEVTQINKLLFSSLVHLVYCGGVS